MSEWMNVEDNLPTESGLYWVIIEGDSEYIDGHFCVYDFDDYVVLMSLTVEDDGPDNPPFITGTASHDEDWDLVIAWWPDKVFMPSLNSIQGE